MKIANDVINWIFQSGLLIWLFCFTFSFGKPWIENKIKHAKTVQQKEAWTLLEQVAMTVVNSLVGKDMSGEKKLITASTQVQAYLASKGINIDMKQVQAAVQAAYELSEATGKSRSYLDSDNISFAKGAFIPNDKIKDIKAEELTTGKVETTDNKEEK
ncbi:hypothetical protein H5S09_02590 [Limosilactobacillus sp. STM2_1]|uniref:Phage holin n=1 Tax=Limosilactobacillus rudii TaxID=2759755 RepID=A0A7W3YLW8_9LACO|nr:phage holin, LLH family [Limosilactobacillus rudii]MBB1080257.1 hypothetical protein [Limosilactobacillus rudii]MBB1096839.1 hypothetical protein [Limosilactobacillus rudii]MCD7133736.1 phage holin family protein [Limosilactobacillus rudii]